jgi:uncharacterized membrane protein
MYRFIVALHVIATAGWLGAALSFLVIGSASRQLPLETRAHIWMLFARVQRAIIGPASAIATVTGLGLTMSLAKGSLEVSSTTWLIVMQGFGLVGGIIAIAFATPMANRLAAVASRSLSKGALDPAAEKVSSAFTTVTALAAAMVVVAFYFGVAKP